MLCDIGVGSIILGCSYAIFAMAFAMIFNFSRMFNLCIAGVYVLAGYLFWMFATEAALPLPISIVLAVLCGTAVGMLCDLYVVFPLSRRGAGPGTIFLATLGVLYVLEAIPLLIWGSGVITIRSGPAPTFQVGSCSITDVEIATVATAVIIFIGLWQFLNRTKIGTAMQAVGVNSELSRIIGIDSQKVLLVASAIGYAVCSASAVLTMLTIGMTPTSSLNVILIAFISIILGGVGSFTGTALGGLLVGIVRVFAGWAFPTLWQEFTLFALLYLVIAIRPRGILGKKVWKEAV